MQQVAIPIIHNSPQNGTFLTQDTYWGTIEEPLSRNLYTYAENNPINFNDPSGHGILSSLKSAAKSLGNKVKSVAKTLVTNVKQTVSKAVTAVKQTVSKATQAVATTVSKAVSTAKNAWTNLTNTTKNLAGNLTSVAKGAVQNATSAAKAKAVQLTTNLVKNIGTDLFNKAGSMATGLFGGDNFLRNLSQSLIDTILKVCSPDSARAKKETGNTVGKEGFSQVKTPAAEKENSKGNNVLDFINGLGMSLFKNVYVDPVIETAVRGAGAIEKYLTGVDTIYPGTKSVVDKIENILINSSVDNKKVFYNGRLVGDGISVVGGSFAMAQGVVAIAGGITVGSAGAVVTSSGVGAVVGVPVIAVSGAVVAAGAAITVAGGAVATSSATNFMKNAEARAASGSDKGTGGGKSSVTSNKGNTYDNTPASNHSVVDKNPGLKGTPNSSVDIKGKNGEIVTRRWYDENGNQIRDLDMTNHGNPAKHTEVPHEHGPRGK